MKYVSETVDEEGRTEGRKRKVEVAPKRAPKAKAKAGAPASKQEESEPKLKAGEKKKLNKKCEAIKATRLQMMDMIQKADRLKDLAPVYIFKHSQDTTKVLTEAEDQVKKASDNGYGIMDELQKIVDEVAEKGSTALGRLKFQVDQAESFGAE